MGRRGAPEPARAAAADAGASASGPAAARILVVEDDARLASLLLEQLGHAGYEAVAEGSGREGLGRAAAEAFDLVLLDLNLPDVDGLVVAEEIRSVSDAAIVMLTARGDVDSRVRGLYAGASDYLTKPFSVQELLARVHARLRERRRSDVVRYGDLELDPAAASCRVGERVEVLPLREFEVLSLLLRHRGRLFSQADIERVLYGPDVPDSNTVQVFVYNLRRKLRALGVEDLIRTVRHRGYMVL